MPSTTDIEKLQKILDVLTAGHTAMKGGEEDLKKAMKASQEKWDAGQAKLKIEMKGK